MQLDLQLSGEHGVFYDAGIAGDWRVADGVRGDKPTRIEALKYYRKGAEHYGLELRLFEKVLRVDGHDGAFTVVRRRRAGGKRSITRRKLWWLPGITICRMRWVCRASICRM